MNELQERYLFTVRQQFNKVPKVDTFYKLVTPAGMSGEELKMMTILSPSWNKDKLLADNKTYSSMRLRLNYNTDMYPHVLLLKTAEDITAEDLDMIIEMKYETKELDAWLKEASV